MNGGFSALKQESYSVDTDQLTDCQARQIGHTNPSSGEVHAEFVCNTIPNK